MPGFMLIKVLLLSCCVVISPRAVHSDALTANTIFDAVANSYFNYLNTDRMLTSSRIECAVACKLDARCQSVNMQRVGDVIACDLQRRATTARDRIETNDDSTYYCEIRLFYFKASTLACIITAAATEQVHVLG